MNDNQMQSFLVAAESGSFSKAARILHVAVPSFSQQMKTLERELGFPLFIRSKLGVSLTDQGKIMYEAIQESLRILDDARQRAMETGGGKQPILTIACDQMGRPAEYQTDIIELFRRKAPGVSIRFAPIPYEDLFSAIRSGTVDLGFFTPPDEDRDGDLCYRPLYEDSILCCVSPEDLLAGKESVSPADLLERTIYIEETAAHEAHMAPFFEGYDLKLNFEPFNVGQLMSAQYSDSVIFVPESYRSSCCPPLIGVPLDWAKIQHGITYRTQPTAIVREFIGAAADYFAPLRKYDPDCD